MLILLAAASVAAAPAPNAAIATPDIPTRSMPDTFPAARSTPNLYEQAVPAHCRDGRRRVVDRYGRPLPFRLRDLPAAGPMLLVDRRINGCPVTVMMRGGRGPRDNPAPPASAYRILPLQPDKR
jgi:hypothetical protein